MNEIKWIKLSTQMFDDEKIKIIESLSDADTILIIWIKLLSLAGKTNNKGFIFLSENIPFTEEMLSTIFNRPLQNVRFALQTLKQFGMIDIDDKNYIYIANWEKHQNIEGMERTRELTKNRVAKHREKQKKLLLENNNNDNVTLQVTQSNETDIDIDIELDKDKEKEIKDKNILLSPKLKFCDDDLKIVEFFISEIKSNFPNFNTTAQKTWANEIRLMVEKDKRERREICEVIRFSQNDEFWYANIQSTKKLRKHYNTLLSKMKNKKSTGNKKDREITKKEDGSDYDYGF